jgi:hypothetical protein
MKSNLDPSAFARIMSLPISLRHDVLEFIGSTAVTPNSVEILVASVAARQTEGHKSLPAAAN